MENLQELWRPIPGYEWGLEASSLGRVRGWRRSGVTVLNPARLRAYLVLAIEKADGTRTSILVHKAVYLAFHGAVPSGFEIDHIDNNPSNNCPGNLRLVTRQENMAKSWEYRRSLGKTAMHKLDRHCKRGHEYTPENTRMAKDGYRYCKACQKFRYEQKKARAA